MNLTVLQKVSGIAGIAGIVFLFAGNLVLGNTPNSEDPATKVVDFFSGQRTPILVMIVLFQVGYLALMTFGAGLRQFLRDAGDASGLPDMTLGATVWILVVGTIGLIAAGAAAFRSSAVQPGVAQALFDVTNISFAMIGVPFAALFGAASVSAMGTRSLPRWIAWLGVLTAVLNLLKLGTLFPSSGAFAPGGAGGLVAVAPIWVWTIAVCVIMIRRSSGEPLSRAAA